MQIAKRQRDRDLRGETTRGNGQQNSRKIRDRARYNARARA